MSQGGLQFGAIFLTQTLPSQLSKPTWATEEGHKNKERMYLRKVLFIK